MPPSDLDAQMAMTERTIRAMSEEDRNKLAQANVNHSLALRAWKHGQIDDAQYLLASSEYADTLDALDAILSAQAAKEGGL